MSLLALAGTNSATGGYNIDNSLKFEADNTEYLTRTPSSSGNEKTWTWSGWVKYTEPTLSPQTVFAGGTDSGSYGALNFRIDAGQLELNTASVGLRTATQKFRDPSAWYHFVVAMDTTQSTADDRIKIYVNGSQITDFSVFNNPPQNTNTGVNANELQTISRRSNANDRYFAGYMAELHLIDGTALTPTDFGEFDEDSGIWKPKAYTGSYGTNGYYLDFESSGSLGADSSGNGNNFTLNNITSADQATDTPTNNFCTLNFNTGYIQGSDATTFTQGATTRQGGSGSYNGALGTMGINPFVGSAKWYWEVELSANNNGTGIELAAGWLATSIAQSNTSNKATAGNGAGFQIWTSFDWSPPTEGTGADGDIFGFLLQCDSSSPSLKIYKNDTLFTTRRHSLPYDFENDFYFPVVFIFNTGLKAFCNFGNPFDATISSGNTDPNSY